MKKKSKIRTLLINQLYPLSLFKDCNKGNKTEKLKSYLYNKENVNFLDLPILNWSIISIYLSNTLIYLGNFPIVNFIWSAILGISFCISFIILIVYLIIYLYLNYMPIIEVNEK